MRFPYRGEGRRTPFPRLARGILLALLVAMFCAWLIAPGRVDAGRERLVTAVRVAAKLSFTR